MTESQPPQHGDVRHAHQETILGKRVTYSNASTGEPVYSGPVSSTTLPACERHCAHCGAWKPQRGLLATILGCPDCQAEW